MKKSLQIKSDKNVDDFGKVCQFVDRPPAPKPLKVADIYRDCYNTGTGLYTWLSYICDCLSATPSLHRHPQNTFYKFPSFS